MGDRGNIVVRQGETSIDDVWFYTHWSGSNIEDIVRVALSKKWRWEDPSYLARIIFDELSSGVQGGETGFGISTRMGDNEHDIIVVDVGNREVYFVTQSHLKYFRLPDSPNKLKTKTFEQFINETT